MSPWGCTILMSNEAISRMELALQVVGLKMTGKIEDAKNVALRIVSTTGAEDPPPRHAPSTSYDMQSMFLVHSDDSKNFEASILKLLSLVDFTVPNQADITMATAVSHTTASGGQTLLHLTALLDLPALMEFLIAHDVDLDTRDHGGYTPLHFAVLVRSKTCATLLVTAGADPEIVNLLGKTPQDIAPAGFFDDFVWCSNTSDCAAPQFSDDGESQWGDVETDDDLAPPASVEDTTYGYIPVKSHANGKQKRKYLAWCSITTTTNILSRRSNACFILASYSPPYVDQSWHVAIY